ncbi:nitrate/nitrite transporter [Paracoccus denitrificans]|uniref:Nitrite transporter n=1 Tax=Paracoccus denitrificans (strain Pd 1222) TaxID=318586 RepID=A1B9V7_PARDP|nr:MFS transporter [Paracoccus denitrificans]ABL72301.1 nitrite transporter [Paracoccus denitrificans PD1222]MBB4629247.1 NNP family nitrate/nitrite transporter-like MFS transporter [Paracoccus denitrificans]WQO34929.1 MFS transporter [Paracoccus denitrificans]SDJ35364.1 MFS transporter, NNP family, nitrate/nitrite transporter [Paracoccus denitrificans]SFR17179.1 MFS transporter, NNP family, nitrate/nitrite transporter [Paracoccus denitrificans]
MPDPSSFPPMQQQKALWLSTTAFTLCFAVWTIFSIIGITIKEELGLTEFEYGVLIATPILTGSLVRLILGVWTERYGGRLVFSLQMLFTGIATWALTWAESYAGFLLAALGVGMAGGSFIIGVAYVSKWFPAQRQGTALGIFGMGNVGAAVTKFIAPFILVAWGWQAVAQIWAVGIALMGVVFLLVARDDPDFEARRAQGIAAPTLAEQFAPLKRLQVWRFALYYFFVFGGFVALALWLPHYLTQVYGVDLRVAGMAAAAFSLSASIFRAYGGVLSDRFGARTVMYWTFGFSALFLFMLSYPPTDYTIRGKDGLISFSTEMGLWPFVVTLFALGFFMSLGKAAIFKHIPVYYPNHVGAVGGLVGMIGGLGGFILPIVFGALLDLTGIWTSSFALLFLVVVVSMAWMHLSIRAMERRAQGRALDRLPNFPELAEVHDPERTVMPRVLDDWRPENPTFWAEQGRKIARRNLWISIPALTLAFAVWMVWSVVVAKLPLIGFDFTQDQLFWLAALPALSGATLRIFYSFMVPIFGGRLWTTLSTASLLIPAMGIGYAVQDPSTPYLIFVVLALLCGLGGANFASSMANISFFFPKAEKGNALGLNAGLGNLGVSLMQFLVPIVITAGVFGAMGGAPQELSDGGRLWMQNAGFVWVPFIIASTIAAWLGMNDITDARASFREQAVIFTRKHNWVMCLLYIGTFGSFIGYSAGFPLLTGLAFPDVNALQFVFLGPLVGALSRAGTGWLSDRVGGGRVTFWVFAGMIASVGLVIVSLQALSFWGFFAGFMALFFFTGVGNSSTFQMIPVIMRKEVARLEPQLSPEDRRRQSDRESAAIIAFTSAIGAYGGFFIPKAYGSSIALTGSALGALWAFLGFYVLCLAVTWVFYTRPGGLLHDIERGRAPSGAATPA